MTEYVLGGCNYAQERYNAYWHNVHLDTILTPDVNDVRDSIKHLQDCKKNPTVGLLARKCCETNNYPNSKMRNMDLLMRNSKLKKLSDSFETSFEKELYPKTHKIRKYLIEKEFVVLDYVKPRVKTIGKALFKMFSR